MYELPTIIWLTERIRPLLSLKLLYLRLSNFVAQKMIYSHFCLPYKAKLFCKMAGTMRHKSLVAFKSWELNYACFVSIGKRDCEVSEWSDWGPCEPACGVGVSKRTRTVIFAPLNGGKECPPLTEKKGCLNKICGREAGKNHWHFFSDHVTFSPSVTIISRETGDNRNDVVFYSPITYISPSNVKYVELCAF